VRSADAAVKGIADDDGASAEWWRWEVGDIC
jgi:hypothetical protein